MVPERSFTRANEVCVYLPSRPRALLTSRCPRPAMAALRHGRHPAGRLHGADRRGRIGHAGDDNAGRRPCGGPGRHRLSALQRPRAARGGRMLSRATRGRYQSQNERCRRLQVETLPLRVLAAGAGGLIEGTRWTGNAFSTVPCAASTVAPAPLTHRPCRRGGDSSRGMSRCRAVWTASSVWASSRWRVT